MNVEMIKKRYKKGIRVKLIEMEGEPKMKPGLTGTVRLVDDIGQIHVDWDNGSGLALNIDVDEFEII